MKPPCKVCGGWIPIRHYRYCSRRCSVVGHTRRRRHTPEYGPIDLPGRYRNESLDTRRAAQRRRATRGHHA